MKMEQIIESMKMLAQSQGFYGRMLRRFEDLKEQDEPEYDSLVEFLESQNFGDVMDMIMFFEC